MVLEVDGKRKFHFLPKPKVDAHARQGTVLNGPAAIIPFLISGGRECLVLLQCLSVGVELRIRVQCIRI